MKTVIYKLIFTFLFSIIILNNQAFSAWWLVEENCSTWIYSANYWASCDACWYFNSWVNRLYYWVPKDYWDFYNNTPNLETIFSSSSSASVIDFWDYLNEDSLSNLWLTSNWVPANSPDNEPLIFFIDNLTLTSTPASRNTPVWRIEYLLRWAPVNSAWNISLASAEWKYLQWFETQNADLTWNLTANTYVSDWGWTKNIFASSVFEYKECYVILPSWCWDWTVDSAYWETCDDWNNISWDWCSATCRLEWWGGWWWGPICNDILWTIWDITCVWDTRTRSTMLDCWNGVQPIKRTSPNISWLQIASFNRDDCRYDEVDWSGDPLFPRTNNPQCFVSESSTISDPSFGWFTRLACLYTDAPFCWNGILETGEACERVVNSDWSLWDFPPFCNSSCQFTWWGWGWGGWWGGWWWDGINPFITIPNHWNLVFGPASSTIIWHEVNPYIKINEKPYIYNDSDYDFSFDRLCVKYMEWNSLDYVNNVVCKDLPNILYPYQRIEFDNFPNFTWNKDLIPDWQNYSDNILVTTLQEDGVLYDDAYFAANFDVRVSRPSIVTTGGWTSYVSDTSKIANINDVSTNNQNKNFAWAWVSTGDTSSFSDTTDDADIISGTQSDWDNYKGDLITVTDDEWAATTTSTSLSDFENYNGIDNVFILKNKNFRVTSNYFSSLTWPRTYIVENANLYIDANISYPENIAFVVKWWNIIIDASVSSIKWTYITIEKNGVWWSISSWQTSTQLNVAWSLYWDVTSLVDNRYYVEETGWALSVWTIVSFGSALFSKPAPLVSQFITEYLNSQKVAK